jgi:hypothetical protein
MGTIYTALSGTCIIDVLGFILEHEWGSSQQYLCMVLASVWFYFMFDLDSIISII